MQYKSSKSGDVKTGLDDYVARMKEGQENIFYIATESEELAANSPFVESLQKKDVEVLYFTEPIDEWCVQQLGEFGGKKLVDVTKEGLDLDESEKDAAAAAEERLKVGGLRRRCWAARACQLTADRIVVPVCTCVQLPVVWCMAALACWRR